MGREEEREDKARVDGSASSDLDPSERGSERLSVLLLLPEVLILVSFIDSIPLGNQAFLQFVHGRIVGDIFFMHEHERSSGMGKQVHTYAVS